MNFNRPITTALLNQKDEDEVEVFSIDYIRLEPLENLETSTQDQR